VRRVYGVWNRAPDERGGFEHLDKILDEQLRVGVEFGRLPWLVDLVEVAQDYDDQIRTAREGAGLSQEELANRLNEKASFIRKLEHGETLPTDEMQKKLEGELDIDLSASGAGGDTEWESDSSAGEYTLGDVVERKDS